MARRPGHGPGRLLDLSEPGLDLVRVSEGLRVLVIRAATAEELAEFGQAVTGPDRIWSRPSSPTLVRACPALSWSCPGPGPSLHDPGPGPNLPGPGPAMALTCPVPARGCLDPAQS